MSDRSDPKGRADLEERLAQIANAIMNDYERELRRERIRAGRRASAKRASGSIDRAPPQGRQ